MDFELSEEQRLLVDSARAFAAAELTPHAAEWDEHAVFPREAIRRAGALGFCGLYAPENAGGLALPRLDATLEADSALSLIGPLAQFTAGNAMAPMLPLFEMLAAGTGSCVLDAGAYSRLRVAVAP